MAGDIGCDEGEMNQIMCDGMRYIYMSISSRAIGSSPHNPATLNIRTSYTYNNISASFRIQISVTKILIVSV